MFETPRVIGIPLKESTLEGLRDRMTFLDLSTPVHGVKFVVHVIYVKISTLNLFYSLLMVKFLELIMCYIVRPRTALVSDTRDGIYD